MEKVLKQLKITVKYSETHKDAMGLYVLWYTHGNREKKRQKIDWYQKS